MRHETFSLERAVKNSMFIWIQKENKSEIQTFWCFFFLSFLMPFELLLLRSELSTWIAIKVNS